MPDFSNGTVSVGKILLNPDRVGETEPAQVGITIHNQQLLITAKYDEDGKVYNADYDVLFGPYPTSAPNVGEIAFVEGPGDTPELVVKQGYAVCGGSWPVIRAPGKRARTRGTQFAIWTQDATTSIIVFIRAEIGHSIEVAIPGSAVTADLTVLKTYVEVRTPASGAPTISGPFNIAFGTEIEKFYDFALDKAGDAGLRD